jgi:hypothetical protein
MTRDISERLYEMNWGQHKAKVQIYTLASSHPAVGTDVLVVYALAYNLALMPSARRPQTPEPVR